MAALLPSDHTDFTKHPGVRKTNSGKWGAVVRHPITKISVWLGSYSTPQEAAEAYTRKKLEYQSISKREMVASLPKVPKNVSDHKKSKGVRFTGSGKWGAQIRHPVSKVSVWLGSYDSPEEAADAYNKKKLKFDRLRVPPVVQHPNPECRTSVGTYDNAEEAKEALKRKRHEVGLMPCDDVQGGVKAHRSEQHTSEDDQLNKVHPEVVKDAASFENNFEQEFSIPSSKNCVRNFSGYVCKVKRSNGSWKWKAEIRTKSSSKFLGDYATAEEAKTALERKSNELGSMAENEGQLKVNAEMVAEETTSKQQELESAFASKEISSVENCRSRPPGVYQRKSGRWYAEVRNPITNSKTSGGTYQTAEESAVALKRKRQEFASMASAHEKLQWSDPGTEEDAVDADERGEINTPNEEFSVGVIDAYGQLTGEFNRLDDELWLTSSLDDDGDIVNTIL